MRLRDVRESTRYRWDGTDGDGKVLADPQEVEVTHIDDTYLPIEVTCNNDPEDIWYCRALALTPLDKEG